jgi:hypothetical protein
MKTNTLITFLLASLSMEAVTHAALSITNGDFESLPANDNSTDISEWYDYDAGNFWEQSWLEGVDVPDGFALALAGGGFTGNPWAYQSIGVVDGEPFMSVTFNYGSFADAGNSRDMGVIWSAYIITGAFAPGQNTDIHGAAGVVLLDSVMTSSLGVAPGASAGPSTVVLDLSGAGSQTVYLRVTNFSPTTTADDNAYLWVDNVSVASVPEPSGVLMLGLAGLALAKRRQR